MSTVKSAPVGLGIQIKATALFRAYIVESLLNTSGSPDWWDQAAAGDWLLPRASRAPRFPPRAAPQKGDASSDRDSFPAGVARGRSSPNRRDGSAAQPNFDVSIGLEHWGDNV